MFRQLLCWAGCLLLLNSAHAAIPDSFQQTDNNFTPVELSRTDSRYPLASLDHSSGFIAVPDQQTLAQAPDKALIQTAAYGLRPNFNQHHRYWLYTRIVNHTANSDWVLHISNFGFEHAEVLIRDSEGQQLKTFDNAGYATSTDINTIGRAIKLKLTPGKSYSLVIELTAQHAVWPPYIAVMSDQGYQRWKTEMEYAFSLAVGFTVGLSLLAFICWLITAEKVFFWGGASSLLMLCYYLEHSSVPAVLWQYSYEKTFWFFALLAASQLSLLAFAASFLQINKHIGRWYQAFVGTALITLVIFLVNTQVSFKFNSLLVAANYALVWLVILGSGVAKVRSDGRYYIIYILGWLPLILSIFHVVLTFLLPKKAVQEITVSYKLIQVHYVQIAHMLLHAVALMLRVKALREDKLQAELLSKAKSRFIAQSSHDLHQPLNSMNLFLDYLKPHIHGDEGEAIFNRLKQTRQQMSDSFNAVMDLSKLEAEAIQPEVKAVAITDIFFRLQHEYQLLAADKNIKLNFHDCSLKVISDPLLLERILRNLISNAIKYTDSGRVVVGCRRRAKYIEIQVSDTGCGIDKNDQDYIFDIYHRSLVHTKSNSSVDTHQVDGSGIGLSIVKHLADLLNHPLSVESTLGKGSSFIITAPRAELLAASQQQMLSNEAIPLVALIFQDSELSNVIAEQLRQWNYAVQVFRSLDDIYQTHSKLDILFCDDSFLSNALIPPEDLDQLAQRYVTVCVCDAGSVLPERWIALPKSVPPSQLRALLNVAARRRRPKLNLEQDALQSAVLN